MRRLGTLNCIEAIADFENPKTWIVMFHGYGADNRDLASLAELIPTDGSTNWIFPNGIIEVPIGPGWSGRAWWPIDIAALQKAQATGGDLPERDPVSVGALRKTVFDAITQLNVPWNKIVLGGFSQGAMLATDIFLNAPEAPKGLIIFSGAVICKEQWKPLIPNRKGLKYFISHGGQDPIIPVRAGNQLESLLNSGGMKGGLMTFNGGHEIPPQVIAKAGEYLRSL
ncbi:MAG: alpha/beta hydrolase [Pseudobdellovibrionaceae bacterium]